MATRVTRRNSGDPGGWGTCIIFAAAMNSPTSQNTTVGASVMRYTASVTTNTVAAMIRLTVMLVMSSSDIPVVCYCARC